MPLLDVSDLLTDPDFADTTLVCTRNAQTVDDAGMAVDNFMTIPFIAVVTSFGGDELKREASGEYITQTIQLVTRFRLTDGGVMSDGVEYTADIISWHGAQYTIVQTDDYTKYGRGFIQAIAKLLPLSGNTRG